MGSSSPPILYEDEQYVIRPAKTTDEFKETWWSFMQDLGWNRGYYDLETYMNPSLGSGMLILIDKSDGKPVGHVAAVVNGNSTAWMSMFIVDAAHRGKGMGRELFKAAVADAEKAGVEIVGLDGVREQKATYERRGFVESPLGTVKIMMRPLVSKQPFGDINNMTQPADIFIVDVRSVPLELLALHELKYTGFERPRLWSQKNTFHRPDVSGFALVSSSPPTQVDDIKAWAFTRRCSSGVRIGPVYAQDATSARIVLAATMESVKPDTIQNVALPKEPISDFSEEEILDKATLVAEVWCGNPDAEEVFEELGWKGVGVEYHRMWVDSKAPEQWMPGGLAQKGVFAVFDAAIG